MRDRIISQIYKLKHKSTEGSVKDHAYLWTGA